MGGMGPASAEIAMCAPYDSTEDAANLRDGCKTPSWSRNQDCKAAKFAALGPVKETSAVDKAVAAGLAMLKYDGYRL
jgi:hypothetical protein